MLSESTYKRMLAWLEAHPLLLKLVILTNKILTVLGYLSYPSMLLYMLFHGDGRLVLYIIGPGITFVLLSLIRKKLARKRPYELYDIRPVNGRKKTGDSFPSRHMFSIFLIATLFYSVIPWCGIFLYVCGLLLAVIRVVGGIHFPKDVICGAIIGAACGGFILWLTIMMYQNYIYL